MLGLSELLPLLHTGYLESLHWTSEERVMIHAHNARIQTFDHLRKLTPTTTSNTNTIIPDLRRLYVDLVYHTNYLMTANVDATDLHQLLTTNIKALECMIQHRLDSGERLISVHTHTVSRCVPVDVWNALVTALNNQAPDNVVHGIVRTYYSARARTLDCFNEFVSVHEFIMHYQTRALLSVRRCTLFGN